MAGLITRFLQRRSVVGKGGVDCEELENSIGLRGLARRNEAAQKIVGIGGQIDSAIRQINANLLALNRWENVIIEEDSFTENDKEDIRRFKAELAERIRTELLGDE